MEVLLYGFEFLFGYAITALAYYFNHRFLFHKRLPKQVPKFIRGWHKKYADLHIRHHKHAWPEDEKVKEFIKVPLLGKIILLLIVSRSRVKIISRRGAPRALRAAPAPARSPCSP